MLSKVITNFFTSGLRETGDFEKIRKIVLINTILSIGILIFVAFNVRRAYLGHWPRFVVNSIIVCLLCGVLLHMRIRQKPKFATHASAIILGLFFIYNLGMNGTGGALWSFLYPLGVFFFYGRNTGLTIVLVHLAILASLFFIPSNLPSNSYSMDFVWQFIGVYFCIIGITYFFEYVRYRFHSILSHKNKELRTVIHKLDEIRKQLSRSNIELEQFAYVASHDLQEPLRVIASYVKLLEKRNKDKLDSDSKEYVEFAVDGAVRMQQLINDLLMYSRVGTKGKTFELTDCVVVYEKAIKNLEISIAEHKAKVTHDNLPQVMADEGQLVQLFQNLIGNALKFCKDRTPKVHVSVKQDDGEWVFGIRDNGIGIAPEHQERVFQIFQRLHTREEYKGTGIGLSVCKKIVERHGGRIWIESEVSKGTTFWFTIPVDNKDQNRT